MRIAILITLGLGLSAQVPPPPPGGDRPPQMAYDTSQETTRTGTVTAVDRRKVGPGTFVQATLQIDGTSLKVLLGPEEELSRQGLTVAEGDHLTVVGVPSEGPEGSVFRARTVTKGDQTATLLDASGRPARPAR